MNEQYSVGQQPRDWPAQPPARTQAQAYPPAPPPRKKRKKRRVFLWVFLAIQVLFIIWLITGLATVHTAPTVTQLAQGCNHHAWWPVFKSHADCITHYGHALTEAGNTGKAIGAGLIIVFWMIVDVILGVSYGVYKLATRSR